MIVNAQNYADFKLVANGLGLSATVFYRSGVGVFQIYAIINATCGVVVSLGSQPGSFTTDYPSAVSVSADLNLS